jgi:uncharacterized protein YkwD
MTVISLLIGSGILMPEPAQAAFMTEGATDTVGKVSKVGGSRSFRFKRSERCFMRRINGRRSAHGKRRLNWDKHLGFVARRHARSLASNRGLWHDSALGQKVTHWRRLAQNTGRGRNCRRLTKSFMRSPTHRYNMLGRWNYVGVGTAWAGGRLYVQEIYESRYNPGNIWRYP